jgi:hypothetical protein
MHFNLMRRFIRSHSAARRLGVARDGNVALEFALGAPVFFLLIYGIVELSMILFVNVLLEGSVREASRQGITGYVPAGTTRDAYIRNIIAADTIGLLDMSKLTITTEVYSNFGQIGAAGPDQGVAGLGGAGQIVLYKLSYPWPLLTKLIAPVIGTNGVITIGATMVVRNEPYGTP